MFNIGNLQLVGGAARSGVLQGALDALDGEDAQASRPAAKPLALFKASGTPALPEDASYEQRSLLNCILSLSKLLAENVDDKLSPQQVDYAQTIYAAGTQLLSYVDRQALDDLAGFETYHGPRSRRSDDGLAVTAGGDAAVFSGRRRSMPELVGKKVLIVDNDILSVYAMTSALEQQGMIVMHADDGLAGLEMLHAQLDTDAVIVSSDLQAQGSQELVGAIRGISSFSLIPIIAVTSGKGGNAHDDHEAGVGIGASDTIDKPVNIEQLLSLMRAWLTRA